MTKQNYIYEDGAVHGIKHWTRGVNLEEQAKQQLINIANMPFIHKHVAAMPDVHFGRGATVGSVIATKGAIIPAAVGVDIGCFDADTEYLGVDGWKKISDYQQGEKVTQFNPETGCGEFVYPQRYIDEAYTGEFIHFKTKYGIDQMLTPDHRCLVYKYDRSYTFNKTEVVLAEHIHKKHMALQNGYRHRFLTTFGAQNRGSSNYLPDADLRIMVMVCADGNFPKQGSNTCNLNFKKSRKIDRAKYLLDCAQIVYEEFDYSDGRTRIKFDAPATFKTLNLWDSSVHQIEIICDEVLHWDATGKDMTFFSRDKETIDFVQYCFTVTGRRASITTDHRDDGIDYRVVISDKVKVGINGTPKTDSTIVTQHSGRKYCFTVPSSFLVMRRGGNIFVTGNCGMIAVQTTLKAGDLPDNLREIRNDIERAVPHGFVSISGRSRKGSFEVVPQSVCTRWATLADGYDTLVAKHGAKIAKKNPHEQLGTLGGGNHFIEICLDLDDNVWIMLHSGSRGAGNLIGQYFIDKAKEDMERRHIGLVDRDLSYLTEGDQLFSDYTDALLWAQDYAYENRQAMLDSVLLVMRKHMKPFQFVEKAINCHHNYASQEVHFGENVWVTRKGAVKAGKGDLGIIPGSMGTGSFIVRGLGNADSFCSCSHGAGRVMSRGEAKRTITMAEHEKATEGIECRKDKAILDESPAAYKPIEKIIQAQDDLIEVVARLHQVVNVKG